MRKALVIVNPSVGAAATAELRDELVNHFPAAGIVCEFYETQPDVRAGEAIRARLVGGLDFVVAAGGDGTVAAAVDGLVGASVPLGVVPMGTGNLVAHELGIPRGIGDAVALLAGAPRQRRIDAMRINGRTFVLNAGVGISAAIMHGTSQEEKQAFGPMAYVGTGIWRVPGFKPQHVEVTVDGQTRSTMAMDVAVLNCGLLTRRIYPKGADVRLDDGHLDVLILRVRNVLDCPRYFIELLLRRPTSPLSEYLRAERKVTIHSRVPLAVQADGDIIGHTPVEIEVLPAAVSVLVPDLTPIRAG